MERIRQSRKKPHTRPVPEVNRDSRRTARKHKVQCTKKRKKSRRLLIKIVFGFVIMMIIGYTAVSICYKDPFLPHTVIDGTEVIGTTTEEIPKDMEETELCQIINDEEDPVLIRQKEQWEQYISVNVTYRFGSRSEVVDGNIIIDWLNVDENRKVSVDRKKVEEYVKELAKKYNTAYCVKELKTSYGPTVKITKGHYGWMIDQGAEVDRLIEIIETGESGDREPVYLQTANSHDGPDYGDTYVEINLTAQHLFYYKEGKMLIESDFVSGNEAKGWSTPVGCYELTYKQKDAVLKGSNYKTPVTYWMPFNGNIGMHDGYWRSSFGGTIYKENGSHGCVNLPPVAAKTIFDNIEKGTPVLCYHLDGTETNKTTKDTSAKTNSHVGKEPETTMESSEPVDAEPVETTTIEMEPVEMEQVETEPAETNPAETVSEETIPEGPAQKESASDLEAETVEPLLETVVQPGPSVGPGITEASEQHTGELPVRAMEPVLSE